MKQELHFILKISPLPIIIVILFLSLIIIYLQFTITKIQTAPIQIQVHSGLVDESIEGEMTGEAPRDEDYISLGTMPGELDSAAMAFKEGDYQTCLKRIDEIIGENPGLADNTEVHYLLMKVYIKISEYGEALKHLKEIEKTDAYHGKLHFYRGYIYQQTKQPEKAVIEYKEALTISPAYYEASFNLGYLYLSMGQPGKAIPILETTKEFTGGENRAKTLFNLGIAYARSGLYYKAKDAYSEAIHLYPRYLKPRINLAQLYRLKLNNKTEAEALYNEVLKLDNQFAPAYLGLALIQKDQGNIKEAEKLLEKAISYQPHHYDSRIQLALIFLESGLLDQAAYHLHWLIEQDTIVPGLYFYLGRLAYAERDYVKASEYYTTSFNLSGKTHPESLNNLGLSQKALNLFDPAKKSFEKALQLNPDYTIALYNLGLIYIDEEDFPKAQETFEKLIQIDPYYEEAWYNLGFIYGEKDMPYKGIDAYEKALALNPHNEKARLNLAIQYRRIGINDRALMHYQYLLSFNPSYAGAWFNMAILLKETGHINEALEAYRNAIDLEPGESKYWLNMSVLYSSMNKTEKAISVLVEALDIHPEEETLRYNLALQYKKQGDTINALAEYSRIVKLNPRFIKAWTGIARLESDNKNHKAAIHALEKALEINPGEPHLLYELGKEYYEAGEYEQAVLSLEQSLKKIKNNPWVWYNLGKGYEALRKPEKARNAFEQAVTLSPSLLKNVTLRLGESEDILTFFRLIIEEEPDNVDVRIQYAEVLLEEGETDKALEEMKELTRSHPDNYVAWQLLGKIYGDQDDFLNAKESYAHAYDLNRNNVTIVYEYAMILEKAGHYENEILLLKEAIQTVSKPYKLIVLLGDLYYETNQYTLAISLLTKAVDINPGDGKNLLSLGKAYYKNKDYREAIVFLNRAKDLLPDYEWVDVWLGRTYLRMNEIKKAEELFKNVIITFPDFIQGYIHLGDISVKNSKYEEAVIYYEKALSIDPFHEKTRQKLDSIKNK